MNIFFIVMNVVLITVESRTPLIQDNAGDNARNSIEDDDGEDQNHLVTHILDQVQKGHVTQEQMQQWWNEIHTALAHGQIPQEEYDFLMQVLKSSASGSHDIPDHCCVFGK